MMAPEHCGLPENPITYSSKNHLDANCIPKGEIIKEEPIEIKCFSEYGMCDKSLQEEAEDGTFYEPVSSNCEKNLREAKPSLTHSWKKHNFDNKGSGYILAADDQEVDLIKKEIKIENTHEDNFECPDDLLRINADLEMQPLKYEDEIDIVYEDIKPEIHGDKLSGNKSHPNNNAKIILHESFIVSWKKNNFDKKGSGYILAADDQEVDEIKKEIKIENTNEENFECNDDLLTINADSKMLTLKSEEEIDIVYEEIKPEIHSDKFSGNKSHPNNNAEIVLHESFIDFGAGPQQNTTVEGTETDVERDNEKQFRCNFCSTYFFQSDNLKIRERSHTGEKQFMCNLCSKSLTENGTLKTHEGTHTAERSFHCNFCSKSFTESCALKTHEGTHTGEKSFLCNLCPKSYRQKSHLYIHLTTHAEEKPFQCNFCSKSFTKTGGLKNHERTHTGEKPYQCHFCSKYFRESSALKKHERTHTGEKPYQCHFCSNSFRASGTLKNHERTHTGGKSFQCNFCPKFFSRSGGLKIHRRTHTGEKPFVCCFCTKSFMRSDVLKIHERTHTE